MTTSYIYNHVYIIIYIYIYIYHIYIYTYNIYIYILHKHPNGPEIGPAFSSIFMFIVIFVLLKTGHLPHVYIMVVPFGTPWWCHCVLRFATAPAVLFHHFNSRTVFAVISHTSAFRCMYRRSQALTYVMVIGLWLDRLPGRIFLQAFQQLSIAPVWASTFGLPRWTRRTVFGHRSTTQVCNVT